MGVTNMISTAYEKVSSYMTSTNLKNNPRWHEVKEAAQDVFAITGIYALATKSVPTFGPINKLPGILQAAFTLVTAGAFVQKKLSQLKCEVVFVRTTKEGHSLSTEDEERTSAPETIEKLCLGKNDRGSPTSTHAIANIVLPLIGLVAVMSHLNINIRDMCSILGRAQ